MGVFLFPHRLHPFIHSSLGLFQGQSVALLQLADECFALAHSPEARARMGGAGGLPKTKSNRSLIRRFVRNGTRVQASLAGELSKDNQ